jgi:hypothetical protein
MDPWRTPEIIFEFFFADNLRRCSNFNLFRRVGSDSTGSEARLDLIPDVIRSCRIFSPKGPILRDRRARQWFWYPAELSTKSFENFPGVSNAEKELKVRIDPQIFNRIQKSLKGKTQGTVWDWLMQTPAVKKTTRPFKYLCITTVGEASIFSKISLKVFIAAVYGSWADDQYFSSSFAHLNCKELAIFA